MTEEEREDLEGKCIIIAKLNESPEEDDLKFRGVYCDCEYIQGNWNCKLNPF